MCQTLLLDPRYDVYICCQMIVLAPTWISFSHHINSLRSRKMLAFFLGGSRLFNIISWENVWKDIYLQNKQNLFFITHVCEIGLNIIPSTLNSYIYVRQTYLIILHPCLPGRFHLSFFFAFAAQKNTHKNSNGVVVWELNIVTSPFQNTLISV